MTEPKRLLEQLGSGLERDLLVLGSTERAPSGARRRIEATLLGAAVPLACAVVPRPEAAVVAGGGGASSTGALFAAAAKWLAIGAFAGGTLGGAAAGFTASESAIGPAELRTLPAISRQLSTSRMHVEKARVDSPRGAREQESKPRQPAARRPSGTVWIGAPALSVEKPQRVDSRDPNAPARASTRKR